MPFDSFGKVRPGDATNRWLDKLGFKPEVAMRQEFYDDLRSFHQDLLHRDRRTLNTKVSAGRVDQEILSFMRGYGEHYFGSTNRGHLFGDAKTYIKGTSDNRTLRDFPAVRSAFLYLSQNSNRQRRKRSSKYSAESSPECSSTRSGSSNGNYTRSERPSSERSERISSYHSRRSTASRLNPMPTPEQRSGSYRSPTPGGHVAHDSASSKNQRRTAGDRVTNRTATTEPWDATGNTIDWDQVQPMAESPNNGQPNNRHSTRARASGKFINAFEQPTRKRKRQDDGHNETGTMSRVCLGPRSTDDRTLHGSGDAPARQPGLEVHFCVRYNRGAFEKWSHGGLKSHTVDTFFKIFYKGCGLRGCLTSIKFTLTDADPPRAWTVKEGDANMFEFVKDKTRRILADGKYVGIFEILMEPTVEIDEEGVDSITVLDI